MAILSTLLSVAKPTGMWESIIWAFEGFTNNYVWAVVLLTIIIRIIWSPLDTYNRRITAKNTAMQAKMQPELQKIQEKYGHDKQLLNQKTNEIYKKNNYNMMGSCGFMLVFMVLNLVIFFTLFTGLNNIASYKIYENYDNLKENYVNCLNLIDENTESTNLYIDNFNQEKDLEFRVFMDGENKVIGLFEKTVQDTNKESALLTSKYLTLEDFKERDELDSNEDGSPIENDVKRANDVIKAIIDKFSVKVLVEEEKDGETIVKQKVTLLDAVTATSMTLVEEEYKATQESFLWIQNIWIADNPFKTSFLDYKGFESLVRANNVEKHEDVVYNAFMPSLASSQGRVNGYFILPIIIIAISFLSMWLSQKMMAPKKKDEDGKKKPRQGLAMQIIMPLIMGIFAIFYNSVFAIYMLASQLISTALLPLQQLIVRKLEERAEKKEAQKVNTIVDYRRK